MYVCMYVCMCVCMYVLIIIIIIIYYTQYILNCYQHLKVLASLVTYCHPQNLPTHNKNTLKIRTFTSLNTSM